MWAVRQSACRQAVSWEMDRPLKRDSALRWTDSQRRDLRDGLDHVHAHLHTAVGVVSPRFRQP